MPEALPAQIGDVKQIIYQKRELKNRIDRIKLPDGNGFTSGNYLNTALAKFSTVFFNQVLLFANVAESGSATKSENAVYKYGLLDYIDSGYRTDCTIFGGGPPRRPYKQPLSQLVGRRAGNL